MIRVNYMTTTTYDAALVPALILCDDQLCMKEFKRCCIGKQRIIRNV